MCGSTGNLLSDCKGSHLGRGYRGHVSHTMSGRECQRWDSQLPHQHNVDEEAMPDGSLSASENYCRNPGAWAGGLWCYTTDPDARWEFCDIPVCPDPEGRPCEITFVVYTHIFANVLTVRCRQIINS